MPNVMIWDMPIDRGYTTLALWTRGRGAYAWPLPSAPVTALATAISAVSGSGVYGGTATLTATLTEGGFPLAGKTIAFTLNGNSRRERNHRRLGRRDAHGRLARGHQPGHVPDRGRRELRGRRGFNASNGTGPLTVSPATFGVTMTTSRNPAPVGLNFNYNIAVTNNGPGSATDPVLTDVLPTQVTFTAATSSQGTCTYASATRTVTCNLGPLGSGSSATVQITVKPREEGTLNNTANVTAGRATTRQSASVNGLSAVKQVDLSVSMSNTPDPVFAGENTTYTMVVKNNSTVLGATGVVLTDSLPASMTFVSATTSQGSLVTPPVGSTGVVTANIGSLATGAIATVSVTVKTTAAGVITNTASVTGNESDPVSSNNTDSSATTVKAAALQKVLLAKQVLTGGCENTTGNVYLTGPAGPGGVTVPLSSNVSGASVPASVFIPAGQTVSPAFNVTTTPVAAKQVGLITAGSGLARHNHQRRQRLLPPVKGAGGCGL